MSQDIKLIDSDITYCSIDEIINSININNDYLYSDMIGLFDEFSKDLIKSDCIDIEGVAFLSMWLKKNSLESQMNIFFDTNSLDNKVKIGSKYIKAIPKGIIVLWLSGNIPTIPWLSIVPCILSKNKCIAKLGSGTENDTQRILNIFKNTKYNNISGKDILKYIKFIYYDKNNVDVSKKLSLLANVRMVWGEEKSINSILFYPKNYNTKDIIFGPKYSLGIIGKEILEKGSINSILNGFAKDITMFDQMACSSPHTIFFEKNSKYSSKQLAEILSGYFNNNDISDFYLTSRILSNRAKYSMQKDCDILCSKNCSWTVCIHNKISLEKQIHGRTIYIVEINSYNDIINILSNNVQTIGVALGDSEEDFYNKASARGVSRFIKPGAMNIYDIPWDGVNIISELVNFSTYRS